LADDVNAARYTVLDLGTTNRPSCLTNQQANYHKALLTRYAQRMGA